MGLAIIVPNISFASANLGQVTLVEDVDVTAISIEGESSVYNEDNSATYSINYTPTNTNKRGVVWSIESGNSYASIDANTGVLSVLEGADNNSVTIKAVSSYHSNIIATKTINVSYKVFKQYTDITTSEHYFLFDGNEYFGSVVTIRNTDKVVTVFERVNSIISQTIWGHRSSASSDNDSYMLNFEQYGQIGMKFNGNKRVSIGVVNNGDRNIVIQNSTEQTISPIPEDKGFNDSTYSCVNESGLIHIGWMSLSSGVSKETKFKGKLYGIRVYDSEDNIIHNFVPQSNLKLLDEVTEIEYETIGTGLQYA